MKFTERVRMIWRGPEVAEELRTAIAEAKSETDSLAIEMSRDFDRFKDETEDEIKALDDNLSNRPDNDDYEKLDVKIEDCTDYLNKLEDRVKELEDDHVDLLSHGDSFKRIIAIEKRQQLIIDALAELIKRMVPASDAQHSSTLTSVISLEAIKEVR